MKKYRVPVASHIVGVVEYDSLEEYHQKAEELWSASGFGIDDDWELIKLNTAEIEEFKVNLPSD